MRFGGRGRVASALLLVAVLVGGWPATPAGAQKVAAPGPATINVDRLALDMGTKQLRTDVSAAPACSDSLDDPNDADTAADYPADQECSSASDDSEIKPGFQAKITPRFVGTIDGGGNVSVPIGGITLPVLYVENADAGGDGVVTARLLPTHDASGSINPLTGRASLRLRVRIAIEAEKLPSDCTVGTASAPVDVNVLDTAAADGAPYVAATGGATFANHTFAVPGSTCGFFAGTVNSALGLPSASGNNHAVAVTRTDPAPQPAIRASVTASPTSVTAPGVVNFDASTSTATRPIARFELDSDGNGTVDLTSTSATFSFSYTGAGTFVPVVAVVDDQGDRALASGPSISVAPDPNPPPTMDKSTRLVADAISGVAGTRTRLKFRATLSSVASGERIASRTVTFKTSDGVTRCSATTSSNGVASCQATIRKSGRPPTYTASFAGDSTWDPVTSSPAAITYT